MVVGIPLCNLFSSRCSWFLSGSLQTNMEPCECSFSLCEHDTWHGMQVQYRQSSTYTLKIARVFIQVDFFAHWSCSSTTMFIHWLISSVESLEEMQKMKMNIRDEHKKRNAGQHNEILRKQRHHAGMIRLIGFSIKILNENNYSKWMDRWMKALLEH